MKKFIKWFFIVTGSLFLFFLLIGIFTEPDPAIKPQKDLTPAEIETQRIEQVNSDIKTIEKQIKLLKDYTWGAANVLAQYDSNAVKADEIFKNNNTYVTGRITDIGKDIMDNPYITIGDYKFSSVQCMFSKNSTSKLMNLQKGQVVLLKGICKGKLMNVLLRDCSFEETIPQLNKKLKALKAEI